MSASLIPTPVMQFFDSNGNPLSGGKVYTYAAGTSTPLATYTDQGGATPNANPVILDSRGEAAIWFGDSSYKLILKTSADVLIWTADNVTAALASLAGSSGSSLVGFLQAGTGAVARTVQAKERDVVSVKDFGAVGDGTTDDTVAVQKAIDAFIGTTTQFPPVDIPTRMGGIVYFPAGNFLITSIKLKNFVMLSGDGQLTTILVSGGGIKMQNTTANNYGACFNSGIQNITIQGSAGTETLLTNGVNELAGSSYSANSTASIVDCRFSNVIFQNCAYPLYFPQPNDRDGRNGDPGYQNTFESCTFRQCTQNIIGISESVFLRCDFTQMSIGNKISGWHNIFEGCSFYRNDLSHAMLGGNTQSLTGATVGQTTFKSCLFEDAPQWLVLIKGGSLVRSGGFIYRCLTNTISISDAVTQPGAGSAWWTYWEKLTDNDLLDHFIVPTGAAWDWAASTTYYQSTISSPTFEGCRFFSGPSTRQGKGLTTIIPAGSGFTNGETCTITGGFSGSAGTGTITTATPSGSSFSLVSAVAVSAGGGSYARRDIVTLTGNTSGKTMSAIITADAGGVVLTITPLPFRYGYFDGDLFTVVRNCMTGSGINFRFEVTDRSLSADFIENEFSTVIFTGTGTQTYMEVVRSYGTNQLQENGVAITRNKQPAMLAYKSATTTNVTGAGTQYFPICDTVAFDNGSDYNNGTGIFYAPVTGKYRFNVTCAISDITTAATSITITVVAGARTFQKFEQIAPTGTFQRPISLDGLADVAAAGTVNFWVAVGGMAGDTADIVGSSTLYTFMSVQLEC